MIEVRVGISDLKKGKWYNNRMIIVGEVKKAGIPFNDDNVLESGSITSYFDGISNEFVIQWRE